MSSTTPSAPVALVTGASSGIGRATAERLAAEGFTVHATARRADRLAELAERTGCLTHVVDVRDAAAMSELVEAIGSIDVLVNNAGLGRMDGGLAQSSIDDIAVTIETNVTALLVVTRAVLGPMIARRSGHVVNVGSITALYASQSAVYGASKAAIHRLSTNLRLELRGTGVRVTEICPGRVVTEFYDVAISDPQRRAAATDTGITEITAAETADAIHYAIAVPAHVNINRIELQPTGQTYGGSNFDPVAEADTW